MRRVVNGTYGVKHDGTMAMVDDMAMRSEATKPPRLVTTLKPYTYGKLVILWWFNGDLMGFTSW